MAYQPHMDGLEENEWDDMKLVVAQLGLHVDELEKRRAKKRDIHVAQRKLQDELNNLLQLVDEFSQRPRPAAARKSRQPQLDDLSRHIVREMYAIIKGLDDDGAHLADNMDLKAKAEELRAYHQRHVNQAQVIDKIWEPEKDVSLDQNRSATPPPWSPAPSFSAMEEDTTPEKKGVSHHKDSETDLDWPGPTTVPNDDSDDNAQETVAEEDSSIETSEEEGSNMEEEEDVAEGIEGDLEDEADQEDDGDDEDDGDQDSQGNQADQEDSKDEERV